MCTAATYKTKDFYFGRTLDYEFSYGDQIVITPRNYSFHFRHVGDMEHHYWNGPCSRGLSFVL